MLGPCLCKFLADYFKRQMVGSWKSCVLNLLMFLEVKGQQRSRSETFNHGKVKLLYFWFHLIHKQSLFLWSNFMYSNISSSRSKSENLISRTPKLKAALPFWMWFVDSPQEPSVRIEAICYLSAITQEGSYSRSVM